MTKARWKTANFFENATKAFVVFVPIVMMLVVASVGLSMFVDSSTFFELVKGTIVVCVAMFMATLWFFSVGAIVYG